MTFLFLMLSSRIQKGHELILDTYIQYYSNTTVSTMTTEHEQGDLPLYTPSYIPIGAKGMSTDLHWSLDPRTTPADDS